jgi:hypothetical protein
MSIRTIPVSSCLLVATLLSCPAVEEKKQVPAPALAKPAPAAPAKTRDDETAMREFKAEIAAIRALGEKMTGEAKGNPAAGMRMMKATTEKLAAVPTDGLPEDLKTAYDRMAKFWKATGEIYDDMPEDDAAVEAWGRKKFSDPKFEEKFKPIMIEGKTAGAELIKVTKKYGIEIEMAGK